MEDRDHRDSDVEGRPRASDFIRDAIREDLASGRFDRVHTRFPPEPNAYLHIGHAKAVWIDYGIACDFGGKFNLRFDDTNPLKEDQEFVDAVIEDVRWLGADWEDRLFYASDYFEQMYQWACDLIRKGKAYVCDLSAEDVRSTRGTLTEPGRNSPFRNRGVEENLDLFARMRAGEYPDASRTLRARIDMASPNLLLRDPVMYRIIHAPHHRQGDAWCIYPTYDWAHGLEDSIEGVTHSLCSQEYEIHRPLYDWFLIELGIYRPRQIEFGRLNMTHTVMSKRRFIELVEGGYVSGYDDPRLPTLAGLRRRGVTPDAIREFCGRIGIAKGNSVVDSAVLDDCVRDDLNRTSPRTMAVLRPLKVVLTNYPENQTEEMEVVINPEDPAAGSRTALFARELWIEQEDFREDPPPNYFRMAPGREVRLRAAYIVRCNEVIKDAEGNVVELRCTYDPESRGGTAPDGRKVKATLHWLAAAVAKAATIRLYGPLFATADPDDVAEDGTFTDNLNPDSMVEIEGLVPPEVAAAPCGTRYQFERIGYFCVDRDSTPEHPALNRTVTLRDTWAKLEKREP